MHSPSSLELPLLCTNLELQSSSVDESISLYIERILNEREEKSSIETRAKEEKKRGLDRRNVGWALAANIVALAALGALVSLFAHDGADFWKWGPSDALVIVSVKVDTWGVYWAVVFATSIVGVLDVLVNEIASPVLGFNTYNPDKQEITSFTRWELNCATNLMFATNSIRSVFVTVLNVTQVDLALWNVAFREVASFFMVRYLLSHKTFKCPDEKDTTSIP